MASNKLCKLLIFSIAIATVVSLQHFCEQEGYTTSIDISKSKISKNFVYEYKI